MKKPKRQGVMLAYPATEKAMLKLGDTCYAQPKLNGERARVEWFHGKPVLLSSYGNEFKFLRYIKEAIKDNFLFKQEPLDGELYVHGWSRERIHSACSRKINENLDTKKLEFHIFDFKSEEKQWRRIYHLKSASFIWPLVGVPYTIIRTAPEEWMRQVYEYTQEGYEGAIFRDPLFHYEEKRSKGLLKFKPTEIDTYRIFQVNEAISQEGELKNMVGSFTVAGDDGTKFDVGAGKLSHRERRKLWVYKEELIGKDLEVKHELLKTVKGIPLCTVAIRVLE